MSINHIQKYLEISPLIGWWHRDQILLVPYNFACKELRQFLFHQFGMRLHQDQPKLIILLGYVPKIIVYDSSIMTRIEGIEGHVGAREWHISILLDYGRNITILFLILTLRFLVYSERRRSSQMSINVLRVRHCLYYTVRALCNGLT